MLRRGSVARYADADVADVVSGQQRQTCRLKDAARPTCSAHGRCEYLQSIVPERAEGLQRKREQFHRE